MTLFCANESVEIHAFSDSSGVLFYNVDSEASVIVPCDLVNIIKQEEELQIDAAPETADQLLHYGFIRRAE
ncbi:hypothetical protein D210916BOD24_21830 [Alteromonas sp. D210916BOD_24]|uniref:hypothetical protein n=1 Tax=Alteromonas sp. D210916BOD_24 TaxID=3157618 RepID=UPI00399C8BC7